jgi:predicted amidohydrolase YtcJ
LVSLPGKLADMVILSDNPLTCDPMSINKIVVRLGQALGIATNLPTAVDR